MNIKIMIINGNLLSLIDDKTRIELLRKNWMSHDERCQMTIVREFGWEKGNKLNKSIITEMGKVMMFRIMNALGISRVNNIDELKALCLAAMELYYPPPSMVYQFEDQSDSELLGIVKRCNVLESVKKLGVSEFYECGCLAMRSGWYKAIGLGVEEELLTCLKNGDNVCKIALHVKEWKNKK